MTAALDPGLYIHSLRVRPPPFLSPSQTMISVSTYCKSNRSGKQKPSSSSMYWTTMPGQRYSQLIPWSWQIEHALSHKSDPRMFAGPSVTFLFWRRPAEAAQVAATWSCRHRVTGGHRGVTQPFAAHGWHVTGDKIDPTIVRSANNNN